MRCIKGTAPLEVRKGQSDPRSKPDLWKTRPTGGSILYCLFLQDHRKPFDDWTGGEAWRWMWAEACPKGELSQSVESVWMRWQEEGRSFDRRPESLDSKG